MVFVIATIGIFIAIAFFYRASNLASETWYRFNFFDSNGKLYAVPFLSGRGTEAPLWVLNENGDFERELGFENNSMVAGCADSTLGASSKGGLFKLENGWSPIHLEHVSLRKINNIYCIWDDTFVSTLENKIYLMDSKAKVQNTIVTKARPNEMGLLFLGGITSFSGSGKRYIVFSDNSFNSFLYNFDDHIESRLFSTTEDIAGVSGQNIVEIVEDGIYLASGRHLYHSKDFGQNWTQLITPDNGLIRSVNHLNGNLFVASDSGVYYKTGEKWKKIWADRTRSNGYGLLGKGAIVGNSIHYPLNRTVSKNPVFSISIDSKDKSFAEHIRR